MGQVLGETGNEWFVTSKKFTNRKIIHARGSTRILRIHIVQSLRAEAAMAHGLQRCRKTTAMRDTSGTRHPNH